RLFAGNHGASRHALHLIFCRAAREPPEAHDDYQEWIKTILFFRFINIHSCMYIKRDDTQHGVYAHQMSSVALFWTLNPAPASAVIEYIFGTEEREHDPDYRNARFKEIVQS